MGTGVRSLAIKYSAVRLTQGNQTCKEALSRGDLADRLAATLNKSLKGRVQAG